MEDDMDNGKLERGVMTAEQMAADIQTWIAYARVPEGALDIFEPVRVRLELALDALAWQVKWHLSELSTARDADARWLIASLYNQLEMHTAGPFDNVE